MRNRNQGGLCKDVSNDVRVRVGAYRDLLPTCYYHHVSQYNRPRQFKERKRDAKATECPELLVIIPSQLSSSVWTDLVSQLAASLQQLEPAQTNQWTHHREKNNTVLYHNVVAHVVSMFSEQDWLFAASE
jgi:hypothetical protein